ncbi:MAG TPA: SRPBCC domain-containing protein [Acidimicrobiales bacterium]
MAYDFEVVGQIPATPQEIYEAWLSSEGHSAMTGGVAHIDPALGGEFDAWDGYIHGKNLVLEPFTRIVQTWRTSQFTDEHEDSKIEVLLEANGDGTLMTVRHSNVPDDQLGYENGGWEKSYVTPMQQHFATK